MTKQIYQIQIALKGFKPKIWRRVLISSDTPMYRFHEVIQVSMGWEGGHLHQFEKNGIFYSTKMEGDDMWGEMDTVDYKKLKVSHLLKQEKDKMRYEYDFGDSWEHDIILEKILEPDEKLKYPVCIAGKMNCPPEDCGGIWGYEDLLEIIKNPKHEEYKEMMEWLGDDFDPEHFDKDEANNVLLYFSEKKSSRK